MASVEVLLQDPLGGVLSGRLLISSLPGAAEDPRLASESEDYARGAPSVQLREASTYRYVIRDLEAVVSLEPAELFDPDDEDRLTGRLRTGEAVGDVRVEATGRNGVVLQGRLEVRAAKFADEEAFGMMLSDLARSSVEALHQGFAASAGRFSNAPGPTPRLLYQRFAVLHSMLFERELAWALDEVLARPHRAWVAHQEQRPAGRAARGSSALSRSLVRPGRRVLSSRAGLPSLPASVTTERTDETVDTVPNRYVRFVLEEWRALTLHAFVAARGLSGAPQRRGVHQAQRALDRLDELLANPLFRAVGRLTAPPQDNQVLLRREGYRQLAGAAAIVDASLGLDLDLEDPFLVSRRSIATLYEYWVFVRLARTVAEACGGPGVEAQLFHAGQDGMSLVLNSGKVSRLQRRAHVSGEEVLVDLFFNRTFSVSSWTRPMRPDASMLVRTPGGPEQWLHFDAKYRVDWSTPFDTGDVHAEEAAEQVGNSKRSDLLKMHAYRDAIRESAGSYVIFPGDAPLEFRFDNAEPLPSLGAFGLRPDRIDEDAAALRAFVERVLKHSVAAATRHRRATYWAGRAYSESSSALPAAASPVRTPPADTPVLLCYVRSLAQWRWIVERRMYNIRSGVRRGAVSLEGEELGPQLLLFYGQTGSGVAQLGRRRAGWRAATRSELLALAYPGPGGDTYLLAEFEPLPAPVWLEAVEPRALIPPGHVHGRPLVKTWLDIVLSAQG